VVGYIGGVLVRQAGALIGSSKIPRAVSVAMILAQGRPQARVTRASPAHLIDGDEQSGLPVHMASAWPGQASGRPGG
jgi:hypothetical protein